MGHLLNLALAALAVLLVAACSPSQEAPTVRPTEVARPTPSGPLRLTIVHSNDTWGYLLPCG